jgi:hypothetical protein
LSLLSLAAKQKGDDLVLETKAGKLTLHTTLSGVAPSTPALTILMPPCNSLIAIVSAGSGTPSISMDGQWKRRWTISGSGGDGVGVTPKVSPLPSWSANF